MKLYTNLWVDSGGRFLQRCFFGRIHNARDAQRHHHLHRNGWGQQRWKCHRQHGRIGGKPRSGGEWNHHWSHLGLYQLNRHLRGRCCRRRWETANATYEWFAGSTSIGSGATLTLDATLIGVGDSLTCTASAEDGYGGTHSEDASVTILNTDPTVDSVEIDMETPVAADTITCSAMASDIDGDSPTLVFSWSNLTSGDVYTSTSSTSDSASLDLSTTSVVPDDEVECVVTAEDTDGGSATDIATVMIYNSAPEFDVEASISPNTGVLTRSEITCSGAGTTMVPLPQRMSGQWAVRSCSGDTYGFRRHQRRWYHHVRQPLQTDGETSTLRLRSRREYRARSQQNRHYPDECLQRRCFDLRSDRDRSRWNPDRLYWSLGSTILDTGAAAILSIRQSRRCGDLQCFCNRLRGWVPVIRRISPS